MITLYLRLCFFVFFLLFSCVNCGKTGRGLLTDNEAMAWRQFQLSTEQHKQLMFSTPQMASPPPPSSSSSTAAAASSGLLTLHDMFRQQNFEKRRLSGETDFDNDIKLPRLTPISSMNTCSSNTLPLSLANINMPMLSAPQYYGDSQLSSNEVAAFNSMMSMSHRDKFQNQQYLDRLRRMNERGKERQMRSRVNFEPSHVAKTVREELASRKVHTKQGKSLKQQQQLHFHEHSYVKFMRVFDEFCGLPFHLISLLSNFLNLHCCCSCRIYFIYSTPLFKKKFTSKKKRFNSLLK